MQSQGDVTPGTPRQQRVLRALSAHYESDARVLAVLVFGSVGRGEGDEFADLDTAVVVNDNAVLSVTEELARLRERLEAGGDRVLFTQAAGDDGHVLLDGLLGLSVTYSPPRSVSAYVLSGFRMLAGTLTPEAIRAAARANAEKVPPIELLVHQALWLAVNADIALQRGLFWRALHAVEPMRRALLSTFAYSRGGYRPYHVFEAQASNSLKALFGRTFPQYDPDSPAESLGSMRAALGALLDLVEQHLEEITAGQARLTPELRETVTQIRARQAELQASPAPRPRQAA